MTPTLADYAAALNRAGDCSRSVEQRLAAWRDAGRIGVALGLTAPTALVVPTRTPARSPV